MKRILQFTWEDDRKFQTVVNYLVNSMVSFKADYNVAGDSTIEFELNDTYYECMLQKVPGIRQAEIEV